MRFVENGPDIPDELLFARDSGNVLFFCGAGVSRAKAGLADFFSLAGDVIEDLGSLTGSMARRLYSAGSAPLSAGQKSYVPVDRMFSSLDMEFGPQQVRDAVARALKPAPDANLDAHRILIDLSRGADGRPRLITTNFDHLFEACDDRIGSYGPPNLPSPDRLQDFEGIIHIHGRTSKDYLSISEDTVVLSSSDFGKAYLSDGWATRYIRLLMSRFKIVFVGYSADDPPVQYLLEALRDEQAPVSNIYAFHSGDQAAAHEAWHQKGVIPIAYGESHDNLWSSLSAWAERARDPEKWHQNCIEAAVTGPSKSTPLLRSRIAHIASTAEGMNKLTQAQPALPSTWLYTFDPTVRYRKPGRLEYYNFKNPEIDPFDHLGLDGDSPPPPIDPDDFDQKRDVPVHAWTALRSTGQDLTNIEPGSVSTILGQSKMLPRFASLAKFVVSKMPEAPALWWAAGLPSVHPGLVAGLEHELRYRLREDTGPIPRYWRLLLQAWQEPLLATDQIELEIQHLAARDGWSTALVRQAVALYRPRLIVEQYGGTAPPMAIDAHPKNYIRLDVHYPTRDTYFDFGQDFLPLACALTRDNLILAEHLEGEVSSWITLDPITPEPGDRLSSNTYGLTGPVIAFAQMIEALEELDVDAARREISAWAAHRGPVFERLRIWAAGRPMLTSVEGAEAIFGSLSDTTFWSFSHQRDLLLALKNRWSGMTDAGRQSIEARILNSPVPFFHDDYPEEEKKRTAALRLDLLHWLTENGMGVSFNLERAQKQIRLDAPGWKPEHAQDVGRLRDRGVMIVGRDTSPDEILDLPLNQVLPIEQRDEGAFDHTERMPFAGYSAQKPARAVLALHSAMKRKIEGVPHYWATFLRSTSEQQTSDRLNSIVISLINMLPPDDIAKLSFPLVDWLTKRTDQLEAREKGEVDIVWNKIVEAARLHPSRHKQKPGRDWSFEAINSVAGRLVQALLQTNPPVGLIGLPESWLRRLADVLSIPGDHGRHALNILARFTQRLHHDAPEWTQLHLLTRAEAEGPDGDAFWSGMARATHLLPPQLAALLKIPMLKRAQKGLIGEETLVGLILGGWGLGDPEPTISDSEMRDLLVLGESPVRLATLSFLEQFSKESPAWKARAALFLQKVWPKQITARTPEMSRALFSFSCSMPDQLAVLIEAIKERLVPLVPGGHIHLGFDVTTLDAEGVDALMVALEALLPERRADWPYGAEEIVQALIDADLGAGARRSGLERRAAETR